MIRFTAMFVAALALGLSLNVTDAKALNDCPPSSVGAPSAIFILFAVGSDQIDADNMAKIKKAAESAKALYARRVCLRGKADKQGNAAYNLKLSDRRADVVAKALIKQGVDPKVVQIIGKGEGYGDSISILEDSQIDRSVRITIIK
jgi:outer membrane protein OmpA-like peptidoglycan-associated protein